MTIIGEKEETNSSRRITEPTVFGEDEIAINMYCLISSTALGLKQHNFTVALHFRDVNLTTKSGPLGISDNPTNFGVHLTKKRLDLKLFQKTSLRYLV